MTDNENTPVCTQLSSEEEIGRDFEHTPLFLPFYHPVQTFFLEIHLRHIRFTVQSVLDLILLTLYLSSLFKSVVT